ncbi:HAMP domain-containing protein [Lachnospiraceae bacterium G11]|nr:HAMP domain-containing protein [Lachnospiraceae bacterium G11]
MKNMKIAFKIAVITIPLEIIIILSLLFMSMNMDWVGEQSKKIYYDTLYEVNNHLLTADRDFYQAQLSFTKYIEVAGSEHSMVDEYNAYSAATLEEVNVAAEKAAADSSLYNGTLIEDTDFETAYNLFLEALEKWKRSFEIELRIGDVKMQEESFANARDAIARLQAITEAWANNRAAEMVNIIRGRLESAMIIFAVVVVASSMGVFVIARSISKGIKGTKERLDVLATNDLSAAVPETKARDEIGQMSRSFGKMQQNLRTVITTLYAQSDELAESCESMNAATTQASESMETIKNAAGELAATATQTAGDVETIASDMNRLDAIMGDSVDSTKALAEASDLIRRASAEGMKIVENLTSVNNDCVAAFDSIFEGIASVEGSANRISDASELISSIAGQTNLLSLNASIEAARAGDAGRGFSVVAEEIRKLSDESEQNVSTINSLLDELQANTRSAIDKSEMVKGFVEAQNESVAKTRESFEGIVAAIDDVNRAVSLLSEVNSRLSQGFTGIGNLVSNLSAASEENAATAEELSATSDMVARNVEALGSTEAQIDRAAAALTEIVKKFKM